MDSRISGAEPTFSKSRQVASGLAYGLYTILYLIAFLIGIYFLFWFYSAIKRIEKSLKEIQERLESQTQKDTTPSGTG